VVRDRWRLCRRRPTAGESNSGDGGAEPAAVADLKQQPRERGREQQQQEQLVPEESASWSAAAAQATFRHGGAGFQPAAHGGVAAERGRAAPARRKQRGGVGRRGVGDARVVSGADLAGGCGRELRGGKREAARAGKKNGGGERCAGTGMG
jgi:hypothetical protein